MFDSGELKIYKVENSAAAGLMPVDSFTLILECNYEERTVGATRYSVALQNDARIEAIVRIPQDFSCAVDDAVVLSPYSHQESAVYRIYQKQQVKNDDDLHCTDLTLTRFEGIDSEQINPN